MQKKGQKRALSESETFKTPGVVSNDNPIKNKKAFKANVENNKIVPIKTEQTVNAKKNDAKTAENTPAAGKGGSNKRKEFSVEEIKDRVTSILSRNALSKRAKRRLALFKKLLQLKGCDIKDIKVDEKPKQNEKKENSSIKKKAGEKGPIAQKVVQAKVNKPEKPTQNKIVVKQEKKSESKEKSKVQKQKNLVQIKKEPGLEEDSDEDDSDDEEEVEAAKPPKKLMSLTQGDSDDDDDDEDDEDDEDDDDDDDDDEDEEEEEVQNGKADVSMEQDSDDDEDDDEEEEKAQKPKGVEAKKQGKKPGQAQDSGDSKKKRYVLFVGNIPYDASVEDLKKHFLTKVSDVASVRIPTAQGSNSPRGFAYVEVSNNIDFEKGLSLHNSFLKGRKIKVEYTSPGSKNISNKKDVVVKNKKLQALRKAGKLAGSQNDNQKRNARRMKQKQGNKKPE